MEIRVGRAGCARGWSEGGPILVVGVTHSQTCMILAPRLRALRSVGFRVVLIASPGELLERAAAEAEVEYIALPMQRRIAPLGDVVALFRLGRILRQFRPQIAEFSTPKAGLLGMLAATFCGVPRRIYRLRGLRLETLRGWKRHALLWSERAACACAHSVLCNSPSLRARALELKIAAAHKLDMLGQGSSMGVDVERFCPGASEVRQQIGWKADDHVIGFVGRLTRDKGVPELLEAFTSIAEADPKARLLLVGWFDGSVDALGKLLRQRIEDDARIHCTGLVYDTAPYYRAMDLLVLPSWREGFPNVVLEAQASEVPVITTISTGARDGVIPEVTGLLIPPGHPEAITESALQLLGDSERRRRMGKAARLRIREHFADHRVLRLNVEFYRELADSLRAGMREPCAESAPVA